MRNMGLENLLLINPPDLQHDEAKKLEKSKDFTEDDTKQALEECQKITDRFIKEVDVVILAKEKDIMAV